MTGGLSGGGGLCSGGFLSEGDLCPGGLLGRPPDRDPPYGNEQAVRILLECILVMNETNGIINYTWFKIIK